MKRFPTFLLAKQTYKYERIHSYSLKVMSFDMSKIPLQSKNLNCIAYLICNGYSETRQKN